MGVEANVSQGDKIKIKATLSVEISLTHSPQNNTHMQRCALLVEKLTGNPLGKKLASLTLTL